MSTLLGSAKEPRVVRDAPWWFQLHLDPPMMVAVLQNTPTPSPSHPQDFPFDHLPRSPLRCSSPQVPTQPWRLPVALMRPPGLRL